MRHKCLGIFLAFLFFFTFIITFVLFNIKFTFLNENFYKKEFTNSNFYVRVIKLAPAIIEEINQGKKSDEKIPTEFVQIIQKSITATWLKTETEKNLSYVFDWLNGKTQNFKISIDLAPFKGSFEKSFFAQIEKTYNALPVCAGNSQVAQTTTTGLPTCRLKNQTFSQVKSEMLKKMNSGSVTEEIPNNYQFETNFSKFNKGFFISPQNPSRLFNIILYTFLVLSILLLGLIIFMAKNSIRSLLRWIGITLAIPSFVLLVFYIVSRIMGELGFISKCVSSTSIGGSEILTNLILPVSQTIFRDLTNQKIIESGIIFVIFLTLFIISFFFSKYGPGYKIGQEVSGQKSK